MFLGTHTPRLDDKGRIFLPAKFRDELSEGLVVTRGQERCLYVWPSAEFRTFTARAAPGDRVTNKGDRDFMRMLFAGASAETADQQGRVTLPQVLRDYAGLDRDCIVIGAFDRVEIWDAAAWTAYSAEQEPAFADWSEEVHAQHPRLMRPGRRRPTRPPDRPFASAGTPSPVPGDREGAGGDLAVRRPPNRTATHHIHHRPRPRTKGRDMSSWS